RPPPVSSQPRPASTSTRSSSSITSMPGVRGRSIIVPTLERNPHRRKPIDQWDSCLYNGRAMPPKTRIHALLDKERTLIFPGVYDALGAKLVERAGFPLTFISGYSVAATQLGLPDFGYLTQTEMVATAKRVSGLEDAIKRCRKYKEAGADALFIEAPRSGEELKTIAKELSPPLVANMLEGGVTPLLTKDELEKLGLQLIVCPLTALYASAKAMQDLFNLIKTKGTTRDALDRLLPFQQFHD